MSAADQTAQQLAVTAWAHCRRRAPAIVRALAAGHYTATAPPPCTPHQLATTHQPQPQPPRPSLPAPPVSRPFLPPVPASGTTEVVQRDEVVNAVKQGHIARLLGLYEDMGSRGLQWEEVCSDEVADRRALLAAIPDRLSVPHLRQILLAWDQWVKGKPEHAELYAPSPTHLGLFLQKEMSRGPTVAASRMRGYKWLNTNLGLPFPVNAAVVRDFAHAKAAHVPKQAHTSAQEISSTYSQ